MLNHTNASKAISDHVDPEDKLNNGSLSSLGQRGGWLINESGLYSLVLSSKLPAAKEFKRWVTHEVLPTIRKHDSANITKKGKQVSGDIVEIPFHGSVMIAQKSDDGEIYAALKPICKNIGIAFNGQRERLNRTPWAVVRMIRATGADGKRYDMMAVNRKTLTMWLATIDTNRLSNEQARQNVTVYQQEAAEALDGYFNDGGAIRVSEADSDEDILARAVLVAQKTIERKNQQLRAKDRQIMELAPKAKALDDFTNVPDTLLVREAAKLLSNAGAPIGEKELREWLSQHGWTYRHSGTWWAASERVKAGHLAMVESKSCGRHKDGTKFAFPPTVRVTRKGLALLHRRLGETLLAKTLETTTN